MLEHVWPYIFFDLLPSLSHVVHILCLAFYRPLHLCIVTWNVAVVKKWVELAPIEEIADAIDIPSPVGTALCMAAALKKDREAGEYDTLFTGMNINVVVFTRYSS